MNLYKVHVVTEVKSDVIILTANSKEEAEQRAINQSLDLSVTCTATKIDVVDGFKVSLEFELYKYY